MSLVTTTHQSGLRSMKSNHKSIVMLRCKLVIVGDACVGKTALTQVFQSGGSTYPKNYLMSVGAEFTVKQIPIPETPYVVEFYLYDCGGQSIFNQLDMSSKYYEDAAAIMLVYSISSRESFQSCTKWLQAVKSALPSNSSPITVLVGNKSDLRDGTIDSRAEVQQSEAKQFAQSIGVQFYETSAANNQGVDEAFHYIANEFMRRYEESG